MKCEICDKPIPKQTERCTNRRCLGCHRKWCTAGGETSPGHGRGYPPEKKS